jgi:hypothetical protein
LTDGIETVEHDYFGPLSETPGGLGWSGTVDLAGRPTHVEMSADSEVTQAQLDGAASFVREVVQFDSTARAALLDESREGATRLYINHHLSELPARTLQSLFGNTEASAIAPALFLSRMVLKRVGLYPGDESRTAVFDYMLDQDVTDYLLAVSFEADGEIVSVEMES